MRGRRSWTIGYSVTARPSFGDDGEAALALHDIGKAAVILDRKDQNRNAVLSRQRDRRRVLHLQVAGQYVDIAQPLVALRRAVLQRINGINAVDRVPLLHHPTLLLHTPQ